ncbi:MAG: M16 family metallopeptidase [Thioalkalivibrionaceae bacterium]
MWAGVLRVTGACSLAAALLIASGPAFAAAHGGAAHDDIDAGQVFSKTLDNGLRVFVQVDRRAPVVTHQVWYAVGSADEPSGLTGISHMLEHMMFKSTEAFEAGEFSRIIGRLGGRENAFTGRDYTGYFQVIGAQHWPRMMELEAERMHRLRLVDEEFQPERDVVIEERRLVIEDSPTRRLSERLMATVFDVNAYGQPIIGWMQDIERYTIEDLQAWYERFYMPNNAIVVVVGDVDPEAVFADAQRHFGVIPARTVERPRPRIEPPQEGERRVDLKIRAEVPHLMMAWRAPNFSERAEDPTDVYALTVLAGVLSSGGASRFPRELVRGQEVANSASASYSPFSRDPSVFSISAAPTSDHSLDDLETALQQQIERLRSELVSDSELERVKAQVVAAEIFEQDSIQSKAQTIGVLETIGVGWEEGARYVERIRAVTADDVRRVAQEILRPETLTVARLIPLQQEEAASASASSAVTTEALR